MRVLLKDGCGTCCTPFPNLFEINNLQTTICSALKWSQSICGVALMPLAPIKMCLKNVLDVQNSLQAVPQLLYIKIAVVVQGAGDGWCHRHASRMDTPRQTRYTINHKGKIPYIGVYLMAVEDDPQAT